MVKPEGNRTGIQLPTFGLAQDAQLEVIVKDRKGYLQEGFTALRSVLIESEVYQQKYRVASCAGEKCENSDAFRDVLFRVESLGVDCTLDVEHDFLYLDKLPRLKNNSHCFRNYFPFFVSLATLSFCLMRWWLAILRQYLIFWGFCMFEIKAKLKIKTIRMCSHPKKIFFPPSHLVKDEVILFPSYLRNNVCCSWKNLLGKNRIWCRENGFYVMAFSFSKDPVVKSYKKPNVIIFVIVGSNNEVILFCETGKNGLSL